MDTVKTLSDVSLAKDWLPSEIAFTIRTMEHKLLLIETTHDPGDAMIKFVGLSLIITFECDSNSTRTSEPHAVKRL